MPMPLRQSLRVGSYLMRQKLARNKKFPLLVELEPLFQCNLACSGCGKIQHPEHELRRRMPVEQAIAAIEESGAPMVSIAGGEPLIHPEIDTIAAELIKRKRFVYLCTNALLLEKKLEKFKPSPYFAWAVHIDGLRERHDASVERDGVFDKAVAAIRAAQARGFRVTTNTTFFTHDTPQTVERVLDFLNDELRVGPHAIGLDAGQINARVAELLQRLDLAKVAAANPFTLSGGEKRRLSVGTALATSPQALVLDEPTFGQDRRTFAELLRLLAEYRDQGGAIAFASHDELFVDAFADARLRLVGGRAT